MPLSDRGIKNLKPADTARFIADGSGLYLRVHPTGAKTFLYRSRSGGAARWVTLGRYPDMSLLEARRAALDYVGSVLPTKATVQDCYDEWVKHIRKSYKRPITCEQRARAYLPKLGGRVAASVSRAEWTKLLTTIADKAPVAANRLATDLRLMLSYAEARGMITRSPMQGVANKSIGGAEKTRDRVLNDDELRLLITNLLGSRFAPKTRMALALCLLTGQRSGEVRGLVKSEVGDKIWRIPPERTKNGVACTVIFTKTTQNLLSYAFKLHGDTPFKGMEQQVLSRAMARMGFEPSATPHDLRRTMATKMADLGIEPYVIEKCLNHKMAGVMGIYNRSEYMTEKRVAWRRWARHVLSLRPKRRPPD